MSKILLEIWRFTNVGKINRANPKRLTVNIWKKKTKENLESHARGRNFRNHEEAVRRTVVSFSSHRGQ